MSFSLIPDLLLQGYEEVTPQLLRQHGVTLLLSDLDYTLAPRSVKTPDEGVLAWISGMKAAGIRVMILSNNRSSTRVETFCAQLQIPYVGHAGKPGTRGLRQAMAQSGSTREQTAMLGDKLLTDILAARRAGVLAIMVEPRGGAVTFWQKVLHALQSPWKRRAERRRTLW